VPFSWDGSDEESTGARSEERRLFYVAMTRAKDRLFLVNAAQRFWRGKLRSLPESLFLNDIAKGLTTRYQLVVQSQRQRPQQYSLF